MYATASTAPADFQRTEAQDGPRPRDERRADCQYMRALERANEVRLARAELKRKVAAGAVRVADVVLDCPWEAESMAVSDLLTSQRRWGHTRCRKLLAQVPLTERKTLGSMTERQRRTLAALLCGGTPQDAAALPAGPQEADGPAAVRSADAPSLSAHPDRAPAQVLVIA